MADAHVAAGDSKFLSPVWATDASDQTVLLSAEMMKPMESLCVPRT
jgi:hypothetical protein